MTNKLLGKYKKQKTATTETNNTKQTRGNKTKETNKQKNGLFKAYSYLQGFVILLLCAVVASNSGLYAAFRSLKSVQKYCSQVNDV